MWEDAEKKKNQQIEEIKDWRSQAYEFVEPDIRKIDKELSKVDKLVNLYEKRSKTTKNKSRS